VDELLGWLFGGGAALLLGSCSLALGWWCVHVALLVCPGKSNSRVAGWSLTSCATRSLGPKKNKKKEFVRIDK
jgi:hypothetical protein